MAAHGYPKDLSQKLLDSLVTGHFLRYFQPCLDSDTPDAPQGPKCARGLQNLDNQFLKKYRLIIHLFHDHPPHNSSSHNPSSTAHDDFSDPLRF